MRLLIMTGLLLAAPVTAAVAQTPQQYATDFNPASIWGDTFPLRISRPGLRDEVVYLPLSGRETVAPR